MGDRAPRYRIGYCSSGMQSHRLGDALRLLADLGYRGVFLTLDVRHLDPFAPDLAARVAEIGRLLERLDLACIVETGARFLLDPRRKHQPCLLSASGHERREDLLSRALAIAADLGAPWISTWSGVRDAALSEDAAWERLTRAFGRLLEEGRERGVGIGFEPEPGMWIETVAGFHELRRRLGEPADFGLSLDCGHLLVTGEGAPHDVLLREREHLACVAIEDMRRGVHAHLPFGEGDLDLAALVDALATSDFAGVVAVELGRHSHEAAWQAERSRDLLRQLGVPFGDA